MYLSRNQSYYTQKTQTVQRGLSLTLDPKILHSKLDEYFRRNSIYSPLRKKVINVLESGRAPTVRQIRKQQSQLKSAAALQLNRSSYFRRRKDVCERLLSRARSFSTEIENVRKRHQNEQKIWENCRREFIDAQIVTKRYNRQRVLSNLKKEGSYEILAANRSLAKWVRADEAQRKQMLKKNQEKQILQRIERHHSILKQTKKAEEAKLKLLEQKKKIVNQIQFQRFLTEFVRREQLRKELEAKKTTEQDIEALKCSIQIQQKDLQLEMQKLSRGEIYFKRRSVDYKKRETSNSLKKLQQNGGSLRKKKVQAMNKLDNFVIKEHLDQ